MKKQFTTKLQKLRNAFVELFNIFAEFFKAKEENAINDKLEILKKVILTDTTTFDKIWLFWQLKDIFEAELKNIDVEASKDKRMIYDYNKVTYPEQYTKSSFINDPIFEKKISDIEVDYELLNQL